MAEHPLDRPVWASLTTVHKGFSVGSERAQRFLSDIGPLAAIADESEQSITELDKLIACSGPLAVAQASGFPCPQNGVIKAQLPIVQMIYEGSGPTDSSLAGCSDAAIEPLNQSDAPAMFSLAKLTNPGPYERRTHELGQFWGIRHGGQLVAMAGERLKLPGHVEISGVCTDPKFEGRGYGRALCVHVCNTILSSGCQPFLHVFETNARAIRLYESLGFVSRAQILLTVLEHKEQRAQRP